MKLLTEKLRAEFRRVGSQMESDNPMVVCKFFTPDSNWTWYAFDFEAVSRMFYGYVVGLEKEYGYFSLDELSEARGPAGLPIERDRFFIAKPMSEILKGQRDERMSG